MLVSAAESKGPFDRSMRPSGPLWSPPCEKDRATNLPAAGHLPAVHIAVARIVAEDQLGVGAVGMDRPQRMAEVRPLVEILGPRPEDAAVAHHRRRPFAQVGKRQRPDVLPVGIHAKEHEGLRTPAEEAAAAACRDEGQPAVGQRAGVIVVERPMRQFLSLAPVHVDRPSGANSNPVRTSDACWAGRRSRPAGRRNRPRGRGRCRACVEERDELRLAGFQAARHARDSRTQIPPPGRNCESRMSL